MLSKLPPQVLLALATLFWAGNFVLGRAMHAEIPPVSLAFWRWLLSGALLALWFGPGVWRARKTIGAHFGLYFMLAMTGMAMFHSFTYIALNTTAAINASMMLASMPMVIPVFAYLMGGERLTRAQAIGIAISMIGVGVILTRGDVAVLQTLAFTEGDLWVLGAVFAWSVYSVLLRRLPKGVEPMVTLTATNWIAIGILLPFFVLEFNDVGGFAVDTPNMLTVGYVALFASIAAFVCWNGAVAQVGANKAGIFIHLIPMFSTLLAIVFLGENLQPYHAAGVLPIVIGVWLTSRKQRIKS